MSDSFWCGKPHRGAVGTRASATFVKGESEMAFESDPQVHILKNTTELSTTAAELIVETVQKNLDRKDQLTFALSGGSTPKELYSLLSSEPYRDRIAWDRVHFFWGDERHVSPDHPESNYRLAHDCMLSRVPVPPENIHRVRGETPDAQQAAADYEQELIRAFHLSAGQVPQFDCMLLGMGPDGHIASLFPGTKALREKKRLVVANWVEKFMHSRITMTFPVLNNADRIMFLVTGGNKAEVLREVLEGDEQADPLPAQMIRPNQGTVIWLADRVAANLLSMTGYGEE